MKKIIKLLIVFIFVGMSVYGQEEEIKWIAMKGETNSYSYYSVLHQITIGEYADVRDTLDLEVGFKNDTKTCKHLVIEVNGSLAGKKSKKNYDIYIEGKQGEGICSTRDINGEYIYFNFDKINSITVISEEESDKCK